MSLRVPLLGILADSPGGRTALASIAVMAVQALATVYFIVDSIADLMERPGGRIDGETVLECLVALALLAGVVMGALHTRRLLAEARRTGHALDLARGAMNDLVSARFAEWHLTRAEAEVALFAIKGSSIAEIARLRQAAEGTVRSQLSQVYAKAGVTNQPMLLALFIEDLMEPLVRDLP